MVEYCYELASNFSRFTIAGTFWRIESFVVVSRVKKPWERENWREQRDIRTWIERGDRKTSLVGFSSIGPGPSVTGARSLGTNHSLNVPRCTCRVASFIAFISLLSPGTPFVASPWLITVSFSLSPTTFYLLAHTASRRFAFHAPPRSRFSPPCLLRISFVFVPLLRSCIGQSVANNRRASNWEIAASSRMISTRYRFRSRCWVTATRFGNWCRSEYGTEERNKQWSRVGQVQEKIRIGLGYRLQSSASVSTLLQAWAASRRRIVEENLRMPSVRVVRERERA